MKLRYNLLWIENELDWKDSVEDDIKAMIEDNAFQYDCKSCQQEEKGLDYNAYDLILMDMNLDSKPSGDELIKQIRDNGIYTDVVFYSSGGLDSIKQKARELNLEGVYFSGRDRTQFVDKVCKVIDTTIRKVQDLSNLRGLVMAEVSELDALMERIIVGDYTNEERLGMLHEKVTKDREKSLHADLENNNSGNCDKGCTLRMRNEPIEIIAEKYDSYQKARAVHQIFKWLKKNNKFREVGNFMEDYDNKIIKVRNNLAHCKSDVKNGLESLQTRNGLISYDADKFKTIRQDIAKYNELFKNLLREIKIVLDN